MFKPPYLTMVNPVPEIIDTVKAGTTIKPSNNGTLSNQNCNTGALALLATSRSMHVVKMIPPPKSHKQQVTVVISSRLERKRKNLSSYK